MSEKKRVAMVTVTFQVEFEDDGELALVDQAHEAAVSRFDPNELWDCAVWKIDPPSPAKQAEEQTR